MNGSTNMRAIAGDISPFGMRAIIDACRRPFEVPEIRRELAEVGSKSLPLILASGFALGPVLTLHPLDSCHVRCDRVDSDGAGTGVLRRDWPTCHGHEGNYN